MTPKRVSLQPTLLRLAFKVDASRLQAKALRLLLRYSRDQPRVPGGRPDGGQWVAWPARTGRTLPTTARPRLAERVTFSGRLIRQNYLSAIGKYECTYYDHRYDYQFTTPLRDEVCPFGVLHY